MTNHTQPSQQVPVAMTKSVFLANAHYFYAKTDGTYAFPNSAEGDLLKTAKREIEELRALLAQSAPDAGLAEDAKRYRYLRDQAVFDNVHARKDGLPALGEGLDIAVDAAIAALASQEPQHG